MAHFLSAQTLQIPGTAQLRQKRLIQVATGFFTLAAFAAAYCLFDQASLIAPLLIISFASMVCVTICLGGFLATQVSREEREDLSSFAQKLIGT
ncbi:MAG: hypothetical protein HWE23_08300 [Rhodobacteraceae bacterium]|nr:hypothetical protein [Paracoccaceae bacterium]